MHAARRLVARQSLRVWCFGRPPVSVAPVCRHAGGVPEYRVTADASHPRRQNSEAPPPHRRRRRKGQEPAEGFPPVAPDDILAEEDSDGWGSDAEEEGDNESMGGQTEPKKAGPLARKMWQCARRCVRADWVWAKFSQRVLTTSSFMSSGDIALIFFAYARIKYRDSKALEALSPFLLRYIDEFSLTELVLLLNAHKKLELERTDSIQLLLSKICSRRDEWIGRHVALTANALAHFYVYEPSFWKSVAVSLPKLVWTMNPLELSNLVSAMARIDRRDPRALIIIARMCRRCAKRNLFSQETLATAMNAFAKLDFNHPKLDKVLEDATMVKVDRAIEMGPSYRAASLRSDADVFDVQALVRVLHTLVCLVGASDDVIEKLLTLISWSKDEVSDYQRRSLKTVGIVLRRQFPELYARLRYDVKDALFMFERTPAKVEPYEARWTRELRLTLKKMDVVVELKPVVDDQVLDIVLPTSQAVVCTIGPYGYYASTTHRTAYSKLHQRVLEMSGYKCMVVPYYEWAELRTEEDKMVYLWSLGRKAASGDVNEAEAAPALVAEDIQTQTDLEDLGHAPVGKHILRHAPPTVPHA